jgi:hypothetical protein
MKCSICKTNITADPDGWDGGNNAEPVNDGICCYDCNYSVVIPARLNLHFTKKQKERR